MHCSPDGLAFIACFEADGRTPDVSLAEQVVTARVSVPLAQPAFDALVSLAYSIGAREFWRSTLLVKLNAGDFFGAGAEFLVWDKVDGVRNAELAERRRAEKAMFCDDLDTEPQGSARRKPEPPEAA